MSDEPSPSDAKAEAFQEALRLLAGSIPLQVRFLNTLSLLEYIGARKILKSQREESMSLMLLSHAAEELRHAKALKGLAARLGGTGDLGYAAHETLCGAEARAYFQGLDDRVTQSIGSPSPRIAYLYETLLIEERALRAYPSLMDAFRNPWVEAVGRGVLAEENRHLEEIQRALASDDADHPERLAELRADEQRLFAAFAQALRNQCLEELGSQPRPAGAVAASMPANSG